MPLTPETWLNEFTVNLTTTNTQSRPRITQLANGNILVSWESSDDTGVGSPAGIDMIGQIFTPMGEPVGVEFRLNIAFNVDDEQEAISRPCPAAASSWSMKTMMPPPTASACRNSTPPAIRSRPARR